jgi:ketosteroid isomerase-like protein
MLMACGNEPPATSFAEALGEHVTAVEKRDMKELACTVSDSVTLILPDGAVVRSKQEFLKLHQTWFKDPSWRMEMHAQQTVETSQLGYACIKYRYVVSDSAGRPVSDRNAYLVLIFRKGQDGWKLIHDQNTRIEQGHYK